MKPAQAGAGQAAEVGNFDWASTFKAQHGYQQALNASGTAYTLTTLPNTSVSYSASTVAGTNR